jgi:serine/threonine protein phosphatase PrpC
METLVSLREERWIHLPDPQVYDQLQPLSSGIDSLVSPLPTTKSSLGTKYVIGHKSYTRASDYHPDINYDFHVAVGRRIFGVFDGLGAAEDTAELAAHVTSNVLKISEVDNVEAAHQLMKLALAAGNIAVRNTELFQTTASLGLLWDHKNHLFGTFGNVGNSEIYLHREGELYTIGYDTGPLYSYGHYDFWQQIQKLSRNACSLEELAVVIQESKIDLNFWRENHGDYGDEESFFIARQYFSDHMDQMFSGALGQRTDRALDGSIITTHALKPGDVLGFCTDGITTPLTMDLIKRGLSHPSPARELVILAEYFAPPDRRHIDDRTAEVVTIGTFAP